MTKNRYLELKYFCLQYNDWLKERAELYTEKSSSIIFVDKNKQHSDPASDKVAEASYYTNKINLVSNAAKVAGKELADYILLAVTQGKSYAVLKDKYGIPCCKNTYYTYCHRFFELLNIYILKEVSL